MFYFEDFTNKLDLIQGTSFYYNEISGLYYKPMMFVNDDSRAINKFETSRTDNTRVVFYDHHMLIVQATGS